MRNVRIALCQIECHPALQSGHISYLEEPFVPQTNGPSLSSLAAKGVNVDRLQDLCLEQYNSWALLRLEHLFDELASFDPKPDIIVFPEGSIQIEGLSLGTAYASKTGSMVLAGTHTPLSSSEAKQQYNRAGVKAKRVNQLKQKGTRNVLALLYDGKVILTQKTVLSPFEHSEITKPARDIPSLRASRMRCTHGNVSVLPIICAEGSTARSIPSRL